MIGLLAAMLLAMQPQSSAPPGAPLRADDAPSRELSAAHDLFYQNADMASTRAAREAVHEFGRCAAARSPALAARTLRLSFRTRAYRNGLSQLARNHENCLDGARRMRSGGLLFAGAMAEGLLGQDATALNVRLARAASGAAVPAFSPTDRVSLCVVRSLPDQIAALFASAPASEGETAALTNLVPAFDLCARGGPQLSGSPAGLRAMLATAAFRNVAGTSQEMPGSDR